MIRQQLWRQSGRENIRCITYRGQGPYLRTEERQPEPERERERERERETETEARQKQKQVCEVQNKST